MPDQSSSKDKGVRETLLMGVFWRILIIEVILLVGTLLYEAVSRHAGISHFFWYALRILGLVGIIILFMMVTLQPFLTKKIIAPLEAITAANARFQKSDYGAKDVDLPTEAPREIKGIVSTRRQMLHAILKVSEERLHLADFIRDTFGRYLSRKVDGKNIVGEPRRGETLMFKENLITASISPSLEAMTDIKLIFNFCAVAHCFDDVYAKVLTVEEGIRKSATHHLGITFMNQKDREVLKKWILQAS